MPRSAFTLLATDINRLIGNLERELPKALASGTVEDVKENFAQEGFTDEEGRVYPWEKRWFDTHKTPIGIYYTHKPLDGGEDVIDTLKTRYNKKAQTAYVSTSWKYAKLHNEGGVPTRRWNQPRYGIFNYPRYQIPARPFMRPGKHTAEALEDTLDRLLSQL